MRDRTFLPGNSPVITHADGSRCEGKVISDSRVFVCLCFCDYEVKRSNVKVITGCAGAPDMC